MQEGGTVKGKMQEGGTTRGKENKSHLSIMNVNARSLLAHLDNFTTKLETVEPDIVVVTETYLDQTVLDSELQMAEYNIFRRDRNREGGGVLVATKRELQGRTTWVDDTYELLGVSIQVPDIGEVHVVGGYRPIDNADMGLIERLSCKVEGIKEEKSMIIAGDFNLPKIDWEDRNIVDVQSKQKVVNDLMSLGFIQAVKEGTRDTQAGKCNLLDVILVRPDDIIYCSEIIDGISDHKIAVVELQYTLDPKEEEDCDEFIYQYHKADSEMIKEVLEGKYRTWSENLQDKTIDEMWNEYLSICKEIGSRFIPTKARKKNSDPAYYTAKIRSLKRRGRRTNIKRKRGRATKEEMRQIEHELEGEKQAARSKYMSKVVGGDKDGKGLYRHLRRTKSGAREIPTLKDNDKIFATNEEKADALQNFYKTVFQPIEEEIPSIESDEGEVDISVQEIVKIIMSLGNNKAGGLDGLTAKFLKLSPHQHSKFLHTIIHTVLNSGEVPTDWKKAMVVPVFKGGEKGRLDCYRPVSLTSLASRIAEKLVVRRITQELERKNFFDDRQHGFRSGFSCETQLLGLVEEITAAIDSNSRVDAIFLDFAKAFDKVPHRELIRKLDEVIENKKLVKFIRNFLMNRKQVVRVGKHLSREGNVTSGVPQGSVVGPLLFLIYIQDMLDKLHCRVRLFADDSVIYKRITSESDRELLQRDLEMIQKWVTENKLVLNVNKCKVVSFTRKITNTCPVEYSIMGENLEVVNEYKYLGVVLDKELRWNKHVQKITSEAHRTIGFTFRNLKGTGRKTKDLAYRTIVRPKLEYCSTAWDPYTQELVDELEAVQKLAARRVTGQIARWRADEERQVSATALVDELGWEKLQDRRKKDRLCAMYCAHQGEGGWKELSGQLEPAQYIARHDHDWKMHNKGTRTNVGKYSFLNRTSRDWNALPEEAFEVESRAMFKRKLTNLAV